jgi:hypothetical protein
MDITIIYALLHLGWGIAMSIIPLGKLGSILQFLHSTLSYM